MRSTMVVSLLPLIMLVFGACSPARSQTTAPIDGTFPGITGFTIWDNQSVTFQGSCASVPFSFTYGGTPFPYRWHLMPSPANSCIYQDPSGIIQVRMDLTNYDDFDAVKWLLTFTNISTSKNSFDLNNVLPGNIQLIADQGKTDRYSIHYNVGALGDDAQNDGSSKSPAMPDFTPIRNDPPKQVTVSLQSVNGRSSSGILPYFNVEKPTGGAGVIFAIGWSGQWISQFAVDGTGTNLHFTAGQQTFNAQLRPGESIRTPAILMMKWAGNNWFVGQNKFRQLMLIHFSPRDGNGNLPRSIAAGFYSFGSWNDYTSADLEKAIVAIHNSGLALNTFWEDTAWFTLLTEQTDPSLYADLGVANLWISGAGNWVPDPSRFPRGYAEVSDAAHAAGLKSLLWFEPERVSVPAQNYAIFSSQHRLLQPHHYDDPEDVKKFGSFNLSDGGNVDLMAGLISSRLQSMHIDILRQDMNGSGPLKDWRLNDQNQSIAMAGIARDGMTEAGYIAGLYNFWDQLRSNNPKLLIDNCASGGRRLDFEALSRTVPLWRSDRVWDPTEQQNQMLGLSLWFPLQGRGSDAGPAGTTIAGLQYKIRSGYGWTGTYPFPWGHDIGSDVIRLLQTEINRLYGTTSPLPGAVPLAEIFTGDFYPMSPYADPDLHPIPPIGDAQGEMPTWVNDNIWSGWEFFRPDLQMGLVQGFRRSTNAPIQFVFHPQGLTPAQKYLVTNLDTMARQESSGSTLTANGISMACPSASTNYCTGLFTIQAQN